jgi:hypothetical protein
MNTFRLFLFGLLLGACLPIRAQLLSDQAEITLLTCEPGEALYSSFGHSAIRIEDPLRGIDEVYNYGTFDFSTPNFYLKFMRGRLDYILDVDPYQDFEYTYRYFQRGYVEQVLAFNPEQREAVFQFLRENYRPENRAYRYDFFFDNCATRIRDVFAQAVGDSLQFSQPDQGSGFTFREHLAHYLQKKPWIRFGIDLVLGAVIDQEATRSEAMFLPDELAKEMSHASLLRPGTDQALVKQQRVPYAGELEISDTPWLLEPMAAGLALLLLLGGLTFWQEKARRYHPGFDLGLFLLAGLAGLVISLLWFATEHTATKANYNLLWLLPLHLVMAPLLLWRRRRNRLRGYWLVTAALIAIVLLGWALFPQAFHPAFAPLMLGLLLRSGWLAWRWARITG